MIFKMINHSKKKLIIMMTIMICSGFSNASEDIDVEENKALVIKKLPEHREQAIISLLSEPNVSLFDLSKSDIGDKDVKSVFLGFFNRQLKHEVVPIRLLDMSQKFFSRQGVKELLSLLENGCQEQSMNSFISQKIMKGTIMKVSNITVNYDEELFKEWQYVSPTVFYNGLIIVE